MSLTITIGSQTRTVHPHDWYQTIEQGGPDLIALRRILLPADSPTPLTKEHVDTFWVAALRCPKSSDLQWLAAVSFAADVFGASILVTEG